MTMKRYDLWSMILRNAEGEGGAGGGDTVSGGSEGPDASILFPSDGNDTQAGGAGEDTLKGGADDWKEYQDDPAKSAEENAAAKAEHDKTKPKADDPADKVPEDGKYDLKMPDGVELDAELAEALGPDFKDLGLTNAQAQKLVDKYISIQQERAGKQSETWAKTISGWADDAKKDAEMGGDKWDGTVKAAQLAVNRLGTPALRDYLNASGGGNHPELIRFMAKAGAMISEDNPASGGAGGSSKPAEAAYTLFPSDAPKG